MNDPLFDDCSIEIIRPEAEGNLRQRRRERYPIGFDMRKVVQHANEKPRWFSDHPCPW